MNLTTSQLKKQNTHNSIVDSLPICVAFVDKQQHYLYNNACYEEWFQIDAKECYGLHIRDVIGPSAYNKAKPYIEKALNGHLVEFEINSHTKQGILKDARVMYLPDVGENGECSGFLVIAIDIQRAKDAERALEVSKRQYQQIFNESVSGLAFLEVIEYGTGVDNEYRFLKVNDAYLKLVGGTRNEIQGKILRDVLPFLESYWYDALSRVCLTGKAEKIEDYAIQLERFFEVSIFVPQAGLIVVSLIDITERKLTEIKARKQHELVQFNLAKVNKHLASQKRSLMKEKKSRLFYEKQAKISSSIFMNTLEGICISDPEANILMVNPAFTAITGYTEKEVLGKNPRILKSNHQSPEFYKSMWRDLTEQGVWEGEIWNRRKSGEAYLEYLAINAVRDKKDKILHYVAVFHDISELHSSKEKLAYKNSYDALTGLPNRTFFCNRCNELIATVNSHDENFVIARIDLDNFRDVNDSLGYEVGDVLLKKVAVRIKNCCRNQDVVARLEGDEFAVLIPESGRAVDGTLLIMGRIMDALNKSYGLDSGPVFLQASIGITIFPKHGNDSQTLLQRAELALYQAKKLGGSRIKTFTERAQAEHQRKLELKTNLRKALSYDEFELHYQPKLSCENNTITGVEALIRWRRADGQLVLPDEFIPLAEESELITEIGAWVIEEAARQLRLWHQSGFSDFTVAINLSARQFVDPDLLNRLHSVIDRYGLSVKDLQLEITEHTMVEQIDQTVEIMDKVTEHGFDISIDDFGTGFSSLAYLKRFPITTLKIDRTFVKNLPDDQHDKTIINLSLSLARSLGMSVIAEGVETEEQLDFLREIGCEEYQGYLCSKPLPPYEFEKFLEDWRMNNDE